ncbi:hypothetical protein K461DRAFT_291655 [Myriangium duriaei CBS 260.36]|uniref:CID domain-containing protein n=1 Tax=Myriangium duriaei CBS 260.36 TaxID=1168546 RepID=A0A9P4MPJ6_9PEZI|nr:hypothetical protein K461DRAFT_291655 [Myriangium duriaei CBS 260.36]
MSALPSDEVALDFKDCLNDLQLNNRYEISNLTIIAKENIEHAQALSRTLEQHIRSITPTRKLPALYVLDSIVKNVGSPYTIYLGRNLFSIFMDAYTLVDANTRKAMESMLRTWKEPVPGSMEPTPVFPPDTTRVIENALSKAKAILQTRQPAPPRPISSTFRNTPTPPQQAPRYGGPPQQQGYPPQQTTPLPFQASGTPQPPIQIPPSLLAALSKPLPLQDDSAKLNADIENLINTAKVDFATNPFDNSIQQRLKALLDLQMIMKTQQLPPDALNAIKAQVSSLSAASRPAATPANFTPQPAPQPWQPPNAAPAPIHTPQNLLHAFQPPPPPQPGALPAFAPGALEALLASTANGQKPSTPTLRQALPNMTNLPIPPIPNGTAAPPNNSQAQNLIDALKAAGLASSTHTPNPPPIAQPPQPPAQSAADLLKSLSGLPGFGNLPIPQTGIPPPPSLRARIPLSQASLKTFNPALHSSLYAALPNQCPTCALRFPSTPAGKSAKAAHLDWHFRTNQRIADSIHRGLHRAWYPDEHEWLKLKEVDVSTLTADDEQGAEPKEVKKKRAFVLAPGGVSKACPICQEAFVSEWSEEAQEWVWNDAVEVGGRVYHQACLAEVTGAQQQQQNGATGILGKRKAEKLTS